MKKYYWIAMGIIVFLSLSLIGYGIYVNYKGESVISDRMSNRAIVVHGAKAAERELYAQHEIYNAAMEARHSIDIIAKVDGVITSKVMHKNMQVKQGDVVAVLSNEDIPLRIKQAQSALKKAEAVEVHAKNSYNRYARLAELDATSLEKLDEARANYEAAVSAVEDARAALGREQLNQERLNVTTDMTGSVLVTYKGIGSYVTAGTPICLVGDFEQMWFSADMDDQVLRSVLGPEGDKAELELSFKRPDFVKAYNTEYRADNKGKSSTFKLDIQGIYPSLDQPAATRRVVFYVSNPTGILESRNYENLIVKNMIKRKVMCVPYSALFDDNTNDSTSYNVYVVNSDNELEQRTVVVGAIGSGYAQIISGVQEGETVVATGWESLKSGQKVDVELEDS